MKGYQLTFFAEEGRRHGHTLIVDWLLETAKSLHIRGATAVAGYEGVGRDGRFHSSGFFELTDRPLEVKMAVTEEQADALFAALEAAHANLFYMKTPVEFGTVGG